MNRNRSTWYQKSVGLLVPVLLTVGLLMFTTAPASAHCDNINGPVVIAARTALETGDVTRILPYVKAAEEAELAAAFEHTLQVRQLGSEARELADLYFYETAVRLHREGEGAAYTGLSYDNDYGPALHAAEEALGSGELSEVEAIITEAFREGLHQRFEAVIKARDRAAEAGTVEANREQVEAEFLFEIYVHEIHQAVSGAAPHGEGGSHSHGEGETNAHAGSEAVSPVTLDGRQLDAPGVKGAQGVMLPLRAVVEAAGGQVTWDPRTQSIAVQVNGRHLQLRIGQSAAELDGAHVSLPMAPVLHETTTMVPAHLLEELTGWHVELTAHAINLVRP